MNAGTDEKWAEIVIELQARCKASEAEAERLREALTQIASHDALTEDCDGGDECARQMEQIARDALSRNEVQP